MGQCDGRVVIVTGGARGVGREHSLAFAREGAKVVVNDLGGAADGGGSNAGVASQLVEEIRAQGGEAIANGADVADWDATEELVRTAIETFGGLDVVVNNAGILRDRMFVNTSIEEWDLIIRVHLRGHFCTSRHAAAYWRDRAKAGESVAARIVNTSSGAGLQGSVGQSNYAAAKAGIAALTLNQAAELGRYGITANCIAPSARTRLTEGVFEDMMKPSEGGFDAMDPANISPLVVWLGSEASGDITGRCFEVEGGKISLADGWRSGPAADNGQRWQLTEVGDAVREVIAKSNPPQKVYGT
ncbi:MAG: SDR family oxidoreductase [Deltaproteobacteria bacterium]|nr:SDR family oxidoreductase [Deltaproteobacteria bacterium]